MSQRARGTILLCFLFAVSAAPVVSQTPPCISYEPDTREEAQYAPTDPDLPHADLLVVLDGGFLPPLQTGTVRMKVEPWTYFHYYGYDACPDRDYHGQPSGGLGSAVLVGPGLILTAGHLFTVGLPPPPNDSCDQFNFVFGYGNFMSGQWPITCDPSDPSTCWVTIPAQDVYSCSSVVWVYAGAEDWGVARLDRDVQGGAPLRILRDPLQFPSQGAPVTIVGHPNRIPMKVEHVRVTNDQWPYSVTGHVLHGNSGSMVVDDMTEKVIGIVVGGGPPPLSDCASDGCYREWFSGPGAVSLTPAWQAAAYIPEF